MDNSSDPVLGRIGSWGRWQAATIAVFSLIGFFFGWHMLAVNILVPEQDFWCSPQSLNMTLGQKPEAEGDVGVCSMVVGGANTTCDRWDYDRSDWPETVVSEFDLVCDRDYLRSMSQSIYMAGIMVGSFVSGLLSDRFGRKRITLLAAVGLLLSGVVTSLSPSMAVFTALRFLVAFFSVSMFTSGYVYCMELVGGRAATIVGIGLEIPWSIAYMLLPLVSWIFPAWPHLQLAVSLPVLLLVVLLLLPGLTSESPRWLLARGRVQEAKDILDKAAKMNGRDGEGGEIEQGAKGEVEEVEVAKGTVLDLFLSRGLLRTTLIMYYLFFTNSFVYYGLTLNSGSLIPGNLHYNIIVSGLLEILANVLTIFAFIYLGRRISVCVSMSIGGLTLLLVPAVSSTLGKAALAQIGRFAITGSFSMVFVYAVEVFPTVIRSVGLGSSSVFARVGGIIAPYIGRELGRSSPSAPLYIFGVTSLLAAGLALLLPETQGERLPTTIEQGEAFSRQKGGLALCRKRAPPRDGQISGHINTELSVTPPPDYQSSMADKD